MKLRGGTAWTLEWRAVVQFQRGAFQAAFADFDAAMKLDPARAMLQYGRGAASLHLKNPQAGKADIAAAIKRDPAVAAQRAGRRRTVAPAERFAGEPRVSRP